MRRLAVCLLFAACRYDGTGYGPSDSTDQTDDVDPVDAEIDEIDAAVDAALVDAGAPDVMQPLACGPTPEHGCSEAECITDPFDPGYGSCGGDLYTCDTNTGEWTRIGTCEPFPLDVHGVWRLELDYLGPPCGELEPSEQIELVAEPGEAEPYVVYMEGNNDWSADDVQVMEGFFAGSTATVRFGDLDVYLQFDLEFDWHDDIVGTAQIFLQGCVQEAEVSGRLLTPG